MKSVSFDSFLLQNKPIFRTVFLMQKTFSVPLGAVKILIFFFLCPQNHSRPLVFVHQLDHAKNQAL